MVELALIHISVSCNNVTNIYTSLPSPNLPFSFPLKGKKKEEKKEGESKCSDFKTLLVHGILWGIGWARKLYVSSIRRKEFPKKYAEDLTQIFTVVTGPATHQSLHRGGTLGCHSFISDHSQNHRAIYSRVNVCVWKWPVPYYRFVCVLWVYLQYI